MFQRLVPFVVAIIVAIAPASRAFCETMCAAHADAALSAHSCHDAQPASGDGALEGQGHVCSHADALPVGTTASGDLVVSPLGVAVSAAPTSVGVAASGRPVQRGAPSPPAPRGPRVPLRI